MSLSFTVTREDMLRSKTVEVGWHPMLVKNVSQEPSAAGDSTNTIVDFVILDGPYKDVPLKRYFSEKAPGFIVPFLTACGANVSETGGTFELENCKGRKILGYVLNEMYNNKPTNKVEDFRPIGTSATAAAPKMPAPAV